MSNKLIILRGLPASTKSSFAKDYQSKNGNVVIISRDEIRKGFFGSYGVLGKKEKYVTQIEQSAISGLLEQNDNLVIISDNTNLNSDRLNHQIKEYQEKYKVKIEIKDFTDIPLEVCIERDLRRKESNPEKYVGRPVIERMALKYGLINWGTQPIVLFDVDGTTADLSKRRHYVEGDTKDWKSFFNELENDDLIQETYNQLIDCFYKGYTIVLASGRSDEYFESSQRWFEKYKVPYHHIFMRAKGDYRPDVEVKRDFLKGIPKSQILCVWDDRNSVCRMWKEEGLNLIQVGDGSFE